MVVSACLLHAHCISQSEHVTHSFVAPLDKLFGIVISQLAKPTKLVENSRNPAKMGYAQSTADMVAV